MSKTCFYLEVFFFPLILPFSPQKMSSEILDLMPLEVCHLILTQYTLIQLLEYAHINTRARETAQYTFKLKHSKKRFYLIYRFDISGIDEMPNDIVNIRGLKNIFSFMRVFGAEMRDIYFDFSACSPKIEANILKQFNKYCNENLERICFSGVHYNLFSHLINKFLNTQIIILKACTLDSVMSLDVIFPNFNVLYLIGWNTLRVNENQFLNIDKYNYHKFRKSVRKICIFDRM